MSDRRLSKRPRVRTSCPCCHKLFTNHEVHQGRKPACKAYVDALLDSDDGEPAGVLDQPESHDAVQAALDRAEAAEVAEGLATLKYERGFQRPDVDAAKAFVGVAIKRTSELAYSHLKHLLRPDVDQADMAAGEAPPARTDTKAEQAGTVDRRSIARSASAPPRTLTSTYPNS